MSATPPTVAAWLCERSGDPHPALLFEDDRLSWAELVAAGAARGRLALEGRRPGPFHLGVLLDNVPEHLLWIVGAALSGAAVVGINPTRRGAELAGDIRHSDCQLLVTDAEHLPLLAGLDLGLAPDRVLLVDDPAYRSAVTAAEGHGTALADLRSAQQAVTPADRLLLLFTSGSTGAPKAVVCTQGRLARIAATTPAMFGIDRHSVTYQAMPLFHGNALMANWAPVLGAGATMAMARRFSASGFLPDVRRFGASYFNYVGRSLAYVLATPARPDDAENPLRLGFGTEASARDMATFEARFACRLIESYGSSEGAISLHKTPGCPPHALGVPPPGVDVAVVDPDTGGECPPARFDATGALVNGSEAIGELVGRNVAGAFEGYYANPRADSERLRRGWYWSGDLGYRDEQGWFYFAGRGDDWLRVDSENFAAAPVERILARFAPATMVAVYAVPDARTGDQVMAAVELAPGVAFDPGAFAAFVAAQRDLGPKWVPRLVRVVPAMPLTASNKVRKHALRSQGFDTADPVFWRPGRDVRYEPFDTAARVELRQEFARHGRLALLS